MKKLSVKEVEGVKDDLQKKFVAWRKDWIKKWIISGIKGSMQEKNTSDNTHLIWDWFARYTITSLAQAREERDNEVISLKSDIARAIGRFQGLGYPDTYLERKYSDLLTSEGEL